jgi:hypothetical protein
MERKEWTPLATAAGIGAGLVIAGAALARGVVMRGKSAAGAAGSTGQAKPADGYTVGFVPPALETAPATPSVIAETGSAEHIPTDLMGDKHPDGSQRAVDAFRPDPTAPIPASERDAFAPALGAPTLVKGEADDIPRRSAEASSSGQGTVGGLGAVTSEPRPVANAPEAPKLG